MNGFDEEQVSASVPVIGVVTGPDAVALHDFAVLLGYRTWGNTGMLLARNFHPTVKGWNALTGQSCRTRAEVGKAAEAELARVRAKRDKGARP